MKNYNKVPKKRPTKSELLGALKANEPMHVVAAKLCISRQTLYRYMAHFGIELQRRAVTS